MSPEALAHPEAITGTSFEQDVVAWYRTCYQVANAGAWNWPDMSNWIDVARADEFTPGTCRCVEAGHFRKLACSFARSPMTTMSVCVTAERRFAINEIRMTLPYISAQFRLRGDCNLPTANE